MSAPAQRGARVHAYARVPSVDLVRLVELLTKAIKAETSAPGVPDAWPLFDFDPKGKRLRVNTCGVLSRIYHSEDFKDEFRYEQNRGFLRDVVPPNRGTDAKMGGRILVERLPELARATAELKRAVSDELRSALNSRGLSVTELVSADATHHLSTLAEGVGATFREEPTKAGIVPIQFVELDRSAAARDGDVARLIAAVEEVESRDWLDNLENPAHRKLVRRGLEEDDIAGAIANLRREAARLDSQVIRFLNFLDDEALARVRLAVTFAIMGALKEAAKSRSDVSARLLVRYVENVEALVQTFCDTDETLELDLSRAYGAAAKVSISEQLRKAMYFGCLPVWAEWVTQMFEFRPIGGGSLAREVSYRFRINGDNPKAGQSAFLTRLTWYNEDLIEADEEAVAAHVLSRDLTELFLLGVVVPTQEELGGPADAPARARTLAARLAAGGRGAVAALIAELRPRNDEMDRIAHALVATLRRRGRALIGAAEKLVREQYICVQEGVIDWDRLASATGNSQDFFIRPGEAGQAETPLWFNHLIVTDNPTKVPQLLFSVRVRTLLRERALAKVGEPRRLEMKRNTSGRVLQVAWRPFEAKGGETGWTWTPVPGTTLWLSEGGVDIEYDPLYIRRAPAGAKNVSLEDAQQRHSAASAAFALLAYLCVWLIRDMACAEGGMPELRILMVRFQTEGRQTLDERKQGIPGNEVAYVASQAVEAALSCEAPTHMQGLVLGGEDRWRDMGAFTALEAAFPLMLATEGPPAVKRIGLISYATRPVSAHPMFPAEDVFLYGAKTYLAEAVENPFPGYLLREDRTQSHIQRQEDFEEPALIFEEIGRLWEAGCEHVMLLWHHYGNWRIGRTADRHAPHSKPEFLDRVAQKFPHVTLYSLRHDVFPATRMRERLANEAGFEVVRVREHEEFWHPAEAEVRRDLIPVYTFATLGYVGVEIDRPQSGFCTYFLELDSRLSQIEWAERARANLIDPNQNSPVRPCLIAVLRGLHFLHAERGVVRGQTRPVLDPHRWTAPATIGGAGELRVMTSSRRRGGVVLSLPALLAHVSAALRGGKEWTSRR